MLIPDMRLNTFGSILDIRSATPSALTGVEVLDVASLTLVAFVLPPRICGVTDVTLNSSVPFVRRVF